MAIVYLCLSLTHCWVGDCRHNVRKMGKYYFWLPFPLPSLFILCVCYLPGSELHARGFRKTKIQIWSHGTQFLLEEAGWTRTDYNLVKLNYMQFNKYYDNGISQDFGEQRTVHYCCPAGLRELSQRRWHLSWVLKDGQDFPLLGDTSTGNCRLQTDHNFLAVQRQPLKSVFHDARTWGHMLILMQETH